MNYDIQCNDILAFRYPDMKSVCQYLGPIAKLMAFTTVCSRPYSCILTKYLILKNLKDTKISS